MCLCVIDPSTVAFLKSRGATKHPPSLSKEHLITSVAGDTIESETTQSRVTDSPGQFIARFFVSLFFADRNYDNKLLLCQLQLQVHYPPPFQ